MFLRTLCDEDSTCSDDKSFKDASGFKCRAWQGYDCYAAEEDYGYTKQAQDDLLNKCRKSCDSCEEDSTCSDDSSIKDASGFYFLCVSHGRRPPRLCIAKAGGGQAT